VADEPTGNLDTVTAEHILQILHALVAQGKTIVMVTHDRGLMSRFSRVIEISDGEIVAAEIVAPSAPPSLPRRLQALGCTGGEKNHLPSPVSCTGEGLGERASLSSPTKRPPSLPHRLQALGRTGERKDGPDAGGASVSAAIRLESIVKTYVNAAGEFPALMGIDLEIEYGEFISLVGKSGSGKSTLLNMLTGIDHPTAGRVTVGGQDIYAMSESERALWRGKNVGIVFQFFQLLPTLTLLENVMLPMDYCDIHPAAERPARALDLLRQVGLEEQAHKLPAAVSSGQQQRAAIARALATDPPIVVADEPTGNLDSRSADAIYRLFQGLAERGKTVLIVTHDPSLTQRTDRTIYLADGNISSADGEIIER
jgi:putative ABC transport system ATP-binding protein